MRNKVIAALVAGGLLVGAGFVTSIVSAPGTAFAQEETTTDGEEKGFFHRGLDFLGGVLDDMVGGGDLPVGRAGRVLGLLLSRPARSCWPEWIAGGRSGAR